MGCGAHSDYGVLTLLVTDGTPGLQILKDGVWTDVPPIPGTVSPRSHQRPAPASPSIRADVIDVISRVEPTRPGLTRWAAASGNLCFDLLLILGHK
jgi:hypothetical protein